MRKIGNEGMEYILRDNYWQINDKFNCFLEGEHSLDTTSLTQSEIKEVRRLVYKCKDGNSSRYIGREVFPFIELRCKEMFCGLASFDDCQTECKVAKIYGTEENAMIFVDVNQGLNNRIYFALYGLWWYLTEGKCISTGSCEFKDGKPSNKFRMYACRFASEFLLDERALREELVKSKGEIKNDNDMLGLAIGLSYKYEIAIEAVLYRLQELHLIQNADVFIMELKEKYNKRIQIEYGLYP